MQLTRNISMSFIAHLGLIAALLLTAPMSRPHEKHLFTVSLFDEAVKGETDETGSRPSHKWPASFIPVIEVKPNLTYPFVTGQDHGHASASDVSSPPAIEIPYAGDNKTDAIIIDKQDNHDVGRGYSRHTGGMGVPQEPTGSTATSAGPGAYYQQRQAENNALLGNKIREALQKNLVYPYLARKRKIEGSVLVAFRINQEGFPESIRTLKGSGHAILDAAARDTVVKASPFPARNNSVEVPITFSLKDH